MRFRLVAFCPSSSCVDPSSHVHRGVTLFASVQIADSIQQGLDSLLGFIPNIIGFLVILVVGYFIAKLVKGIVARLLEKVGLEVASEPPEYRAGDLFSVEI